MFLYGKLCLKEQPMAVLYFTGGIPCECEYIKRHEETNASYASEIAFPRRQKVIYHLDGTPWILFPGADAEGRNAGFRLELFDNGKVFTKLFYANSRARGVKKIFYYDTGVLQSEKVFSNGIEWPHAPTENFV